MAENKKKPEETKRQKFERLATSRVDKALNAIAIIGGLASKTNYDYTPEHVAAIFKALEGEMTKLQARFTNPAQVAESGFSFNNATASDSE